MPPLPRLNTKVQNQVVVRFYTILFISDDSEIQVTYLISTTFTLNRTTPCATPDDTLAAPRFTAFDISRIILHSTVYHFLIINRVHSNKYVISMHKVLILSL